MAAPDTPSLLQAIRELIHFELVDLHTCLPGIVESYDAATGLAAVSPALKRTYAGGRVVDLPIINNVPVIMPRAAGGAAYVHLPLGKGDPVTLVFSERSLDAWKSSGGKVDPKDPRKHHLSDAYAIPGGYPRAAAPMKHATAADLVIVNGETVMKITPTGQFSVVGPDGTDFVAQMLAVLDNVVEKTKVATAIGLEPFIPDPTYVAERAKLDLFKA